MCSSAFRDNKVLCSGQNYLWKAEGAGMRCLGSVGETAGSQMRQERGQPSCCPHFTCQAEYIQQSNSLSVPADDSGTEIRVTILGVAS